MTYKNVLVCDSCGKEGENTREWIYITLGTINTKNLHYCNQDCLSKDFTIERYRKLLRDSGVTT